MSISFSLSSAVHSLHAKSGDDAPGCGTLPPGWHPPGPPPQAAASVHANALDRVALNPQPLPPREGAVSTSARMDADDIPLCPPPRPHPWQDLVGPASSQVLSALGVTGAQERGIIIVGG